MHSSNHDDRKLSHSDYFPAELRKVAQLRDKLYDRRLQLKEKRNELRQELGLLCEIDSRFIKSVRQLREYPNERFDASGHNELDTQRNVVEPLQYDYDQTEDEYDAYENQLEKKEEKLVTLLSRFFLSDSSEMSNENDSSLNSHRLQKETRQQDSNDVIKTRLMNYESRVGDARIMQERMQDILFERERRLSFAKKREKFDLDQDTNDVSTPKSKSRYAEINKKLNIINENIQHLKEVLEASDYSFPEV
jgi:hypothetical protein